MGKKKKILFLKKFGKLSKKLEKKFSSFLQATESFWKEEELPVVEEETTKPKTETKPAQKKKITKPKVPAAKKKTTPTPRKRRTSKTKTEA